MNGLLIKMKKVGKLKYERILIRQLKHLTAPGAVRNYQIYTDGGCGFKKFDAGINVGVGVEFSGFRIMVGYQQGLMNIADDQLIANGYKNYGFYAKVGYGFKF